jgi:hypothetical protein
MQGGCSRVNNFVPPPAGVSPRRNGFGRLSGFAIHFTCDALRQPANGGILEKDRFRKRPPDEPLQLQSDINRKKGIAALLEEIVVERNVFSIQNPPPE